MKVQEKVILFGSGKVGLRVYERIGKNIIAVIDNNPLKWGKIFAGGGIPIISIQEYLTKYQGIHILISSSKYANEIERQLKANGIYDFSFPIEIWKDKDVLYDEDISHKNWVQYLKELCDKPGAEILEIGSRRVNKNDRWNEYFEKANYTGFDYYSGENVDIVGDAHKLSQYFDKKFDLIFSSAVFEHLAMPWKVSLEIIKLLKPGGYIFIETTYCYGSHARPWHFFQFSEEALNVLFPSKFGMKCLKKGCCNLIEGARFSKDASDEPMQGNIVSGLYCHSGFLGQKIKDVSKDELSWDYISLEDATGKTQYPL